MDTRYSEDNLAALLTPRSEITRLIRSGDMNSLDIAVKAAKNNAGCEDLLREALRAVGACAAGSPVSLVMARAVLQGLHYFENPVEVVNLVGLVPPLRMAKAARYYNSQAEKGDRAQSPREGVKHFFEAWEKCSTSATLEGLTPALMGTLYSAFSGRGSDWGLVLGGDLPMPDWMRDLFTRYREAEKIVTDLEAESPKDWDASVLLSFTPDEVAPLKEMECALGMSTYTPAQFISITNRILGAWGEDYPPAMEEGLSEYYFDVCEALLLLCDQEDDTRMVACVLDLVGEEAWDDITAGELVCDDLSIRLAVAFARLRKGQVMLYRYSDVGLTEGEVEFVKENLSLFGMDGSDALVALEVGDWGTLVDAMDAEELVKVFLSPCGDSEMISHCGSKGKTLRWWLGKILEEKGGEGTFSNGDLYVVRELAGIFSLEELLDVLAGNDKESELLSQAWHAGGRINITSESLERISPEQYATLFEELPVSQHANWLSGEEIPAATLDAVAESTAGVDLLRHITTPQWHYKDVEKFRELVMRTRVGSLRDATFATRIVSELGIIPDTPEAAAVINATPESLTVADLVGLL